MTIFRALMLLTLAVTSAAQETVRQIDPKSTLTVYAYKSGLFAFAAHDHVISAPIAGGEVVLTEGSERVRLVVDARGMKVLDPKLDPDKLKSRAPCTVRRSWTRLHIQKIFFPLREFAR